jgi:hypothetical protein
MAQLVLVVMSSLLLAMATLLRYYIPHYIQYYSMQCGLKHAAVEGYAVHVCSSICAAAPTSYMLVQACTLLVLVLL